MPVYGSYAGCADCPPGDWRQTPDLTPADLAPADCVDGQTTTCTGQCLWQYNAGTKTFSLVADGCSEGCNCYYPAFCPDCVYVYTPCSKLAPPGHGTPPNCTGSTSSTTAHPDCGVICNWLFLPVLGWNNIYNECGAGVCACPQPGLANPPPFTATTTNCSPDALTCSGLCKYIFTSPGGWVLEKDGCDAFAPGCRCVAPTTIPFAGTEVVTFCSSEAGPKNPPTTQAPGVCTARCYYCWNGSTWTYQSTDCGTACVCTPPAYSGTTVGETGVTQCKTPTSTTSTTTTTTTTSTTTSPCGGRCVYTCPSPGTACIPGVGWTAGVHTCTGAPDCGCPAQPMESGLPGESVTIPCVSTGTTTTTSTSTTSTTSSTTLNPGCTVLNCSVTCDNKSGLYGGFVNNCPGITGCSCPDELPDVGSPCTPGSGTFSLPCGGVPAGGGLMAAPAFNAARVVAPPAVAATSDHAVVVLFEAPPAVQKAARAFARANGADYRRVRPGGDPAEYLGDYYEVFHVTGPHPDPSVPVDVVAYARQKG